jgi:hypothetical protein
MCDDPLHDDRDQGLWHLWRDEKGRLFAARCPESLEREKAIAKARQESDRVYSDDWRNR